MKIFRLNSEEKLLSQCRKGEHQAQMELYKKYARAMYQISRNIIKDDMQAEEAMQDAFLSAFENLNTFDGSSTFGAWLKSIVIHQSLDYVRKQRISISLDDDRGRRILEENISKASEEVKDDRKNKKLNWGLEQLPKNYKQIISLYYFEGYDHREISEIMEISYSNSRVLLKRAKDKLTSIIS